MSRQDLRLFLLGLGATLLLGGAASLLIFDFAPPEAPRTAQTDAPPAPPPQPATPQSILPPSDETRNAASREVIEREIAAAPDVTRFFDRLRLTLPGEYNSALTALARKHTSEDTADYYLSETVKTLRQSSGALAAKAEAPALSNVFARQFAVLKALSGRDPKLCVDFLYGGASEAFFKFSAENRALVSDLAIAGLDAILDGKQKNISRETPSEADFQIFEAALRQAGLSPLEIDALLDGKTPDPPLPDARMCAAGQSYLETLAKLPDDPRTRIQALAINLMARS